MTRWVRSQAEIEELITTRQLQKITGSAANGQSRRYAGLARTARGPDVRSILSVTNAASPHRSPPRCELWPHGAERLKP